MRYGCFAMAAVWLPWRQWEMERSWPAAAAADRKSVVQTNGSELTSEERSLFVGYIFSDQQRGKYVD